MAMSPPPTDGGGAMLVAGESRVTVWEFCVAPDAEVSWVMFCKNAGIEKILADTSAGINRKVEALDDASANHINLLIFPAAGGLAGEGSEFVGFKALLVAVLCRVLLKNGFVKPFLAPIPVPSNYT